jgi:hypothetical protein
MTQLSLRGFDKQLERRLRELARREGVSLNKAALILLRRGAGLSQDVPASPGIGAALDHFVGRWSVADEKTLLDSIASCEAADESFWK